MSDKVRYGFISLTGLVDEYMIDSFNDGQKYYENMLSIGRRAWKQISWNVLKLRKDKTFEVDKMTNTVKLPDDFDSMKIFGVKVVDQCGNYQPLTYEEYKAPPLPIAKGCGCTQCKCDSEACGALNGVTYTKEDVILQGTTYQRVIKTKVLGNGDLVREVLEPYVKKNDSGNDVVVFNVEQHYVANVSVKPCGCVINTQVNSDIVSQYCECYHPCCPPTTLPQTHNCFGKFKIDKEYGCAVIHLYDTNAQFINVSYVGNAEECNEEIIIPEYCIEAMKAMLYHGSLRYRTNVSDSRVEYARQNVEREKKNLFKFKNPLVIKDFMDINRKPFKWK